MDQPRLSVIVPTSGRVELFLETLSSLEKQTYDQWELIITDDSRDPVLREQIEAKAKEFEPATGIPTRYLFTKPGLGQSKNTNQGLQAGCGEYLRILHSDDLLAPWGLEMEMGTLDIFAPVVSAIYCDPVPFSKQYVPENREKISLVSPRWLIKHFLHSGTALPSTMVFSRALFTEVGGLDPDYDFLCDWKFFLHLLNAQVKKNHTIIHSTGGWVGWRTHENSVSGRLWHMHFREHIKLMHEIADTNLLESELFFSDGESKTFFTLANTYRHSRVAEDFLKLPSLTSSDLARVLQEILTSDETLSEYVESVYPNVPFVNPEDNLKKSLYYLCAAKALLVQDKTGSAIKCYEAALAADPGNYLTLLALAKLNLDQRSFEQAVMYLEKAIALDAARPEAYLELAKFEFSEERYNSALKLYAKLIELIPDDDTYQQQVEAIRAAQSSKADSFVETGKDFLAAGNNADAKTAFLQALSILPTCYEAHFGLGKIYRLAGQYTEAAERFQSCLQLQPEAFESLASLGDCCFLLNRQEEALRYYQGASEINPDDVSIVIALGMAYTKYEMVSKAIETLEKAIKLTPESSGVYFDLGNAYFAANDFQKAAECYENAVKYRSDFGQAYLSCANSYMRLGQYEAAILNYEQAEPYFANQTDLLLDLGNALLQVGNVQQAEVIFRRVTAIKPDLVEAYHGLGLVCRKQNKLIDAIRSFDAALALHPGYQPSFRELKEISSFRGHYIEWRQKRFDCIVQELGEPYFSEKTMLEMGAGYGDLGAMFSKLGCAVTSLEARLENVIIGQDLHPELTIMEIDLEKDFTWLGEFDIVLHVGLLYHLKDPVLNLKRVAAVTRDVLILETEVCDSEDPEKILFIDENAALSDQSFSGYGNRPSPAFVEAQLNQMGFSVKPLLVDSLNSSFHRYDWAIQNSNEHQFGEWEHGLRRFWICRKKTEG